MVILVCVFYYVIIKQANGIQSVTFAWGLYQPLITGWGFHGKRTNNENSQTVATGLQNHSSNTYKYWAIFKGHTHYRFYL